MELIPLDDANDGLPLVRVIAGEGASLPPGMPGQVVGYGDDGQPLAIDLPTPEDGSDGRGISDEQYDPDTGILTLTFTDDSTFSTGDLRVKGDQGAPAIVRSFATDAEAQAFSAANPEAVVFSREGL